MIDTSQTALLAAAARAAHLTVDAEPRIFADTLAATLLGGDADTYLAYHRAHGDHLVLAGARAQVTSARASRRSCGGAPTRCARWSCR